MTLNLQMSTGNASFEEWRKPYEIARILRTVAQKIEGSDRATEGILQDTNGNTVGRWFVDMSDDVESDNKEVRT